MEKLTEQEQRLLHEKEYFEELAKKLCAAYGSHRLRIKSIDYFMRRYPDQPGQWWVAVAKHIHSEFQRAMAKAMADTGIMAPVDLAKLPVTGKSN
jgi:hypothetical protein